MFLSQKYCCGFCGFDFEAMPHLTLLSYSIMDKTHHGALIALFSMQLQHLFSYVGGILVSNHFSLLLFDRYILAIQQIITHVEPLRHSFWSVAIFWTPLEALASWSQRQKVVKTTSKTVFSYYNFYTFQFNIS